MTEKGDSTMEMKQESLVKTSSFEFTLNQPFEETTADGRKVQKNFLLIMITSLQMEHHIAVAAFHVARRSANILFDVLS